MGNRIILYLFKYDLLLFLGERGLVLEVLVDVADEEAEGSAARGRGGQEHPGGAGQQHPAVEHG